MSQTITVNTLRELLSAGSKCKICLVGHNGGFNITVSYGRVKSLLSGVRGTPKLFASLNTAVSYLAKLGIMKFEVDASEYRPGRIRGPRPDRAEALKSTRRRPRQEKLI